MGSYSESEKASQHRDMPSNAVAALLLSGRNRQRRFPGTTLMMHGAPALVLAQQAFVASVGLAAAQQPPLPTDAARARAGKPRPIGAQQTPSGKMGKEEPRSHTPNAKPEENAVFVNGALVVPGAPANTDTVPAKFSQKNAADDELITIAYTFKTLGDDERRAIYEALKGQQAGSAFNADIGTELPPGI